MRRKRIRFPVRRESRKLVLIFLALVGLVLWVDRGYSAEESPAFDIQTFVVDGNTLLTEKSVDEILQPYMGPSKTAADVEKARDALRKPITIRDTRRSS